MIQVRFNTNYGVLPDQKRWRVLIDGNQIFTDSVDIKTKSWTTIDIVKGDNGNDVEKYHVTCKPTYIHTTPDLVELKDENGSFEEDSEHDLICVKWSEKAKKWKVEIKGEERLYDNIVFETRVWTSDISPELCCRPAHIGYLKDAGERHTLYLSNNFLW